MLKTIKKDSKKIKCISENFNELTKISNKILKEKIKNGLVKVIEDKSFNKVIPLHIKLTHVKFSKKSTCKKFLENFFIKFLLNSLIIGNTIILSFDNYAITKKQSITLEILDFIFFLFFFIEIIAKIIVFKPSEFKNNYLNYMELFILFINSFVIIFEIGFGINPIINSSYYGKGIKVTKIFRIIRLLFEISTFKSLSILIKSMIKTLSQMIHFLILFIIFLIIFSLIGKELFSFTVRTNAKNQTSLKYKIKH